MRFATLALTLTALLLFVAGPCPVAKAQPAPAGASPVGINLAPIRYWSREHPFKDLMRGSSRWRSQKIGAGFSWDYPLPTMRDDGYPAEPLAGHYFECFVTVAKQEYPGGEYVLRYDGKGKVDVIGDAKITDRQPGRLALTITPRENLRVQILETDASDPVHNIVLVPKRHEQDYQQKPFRQAFLDRWQSAAAVRFMDWANTNNSKQQHWSERPKPGDATYAHGVPLEVMIELANELNADPWFCIPHLADDDYIRQFAQMVHEKLDSELTAYVEYTNEAWNGMFSQARWAQEQGQAAGLADKSWEAGWLFYSERATNVMKIWSDVFADDRSRIVRVLAGQAANPYICKRIVEHKDARDYADALAVAPYFGHILGSRKEVDATLAGGKDYVIKRCGEIIKADRAKWAKLSSLSKQYGLALTAYEAGQHLAGHGGTENNDKLTELFIAANRDQRMADLYRVYLEQWQDVGGGLIVMFNSLETPSKWGSWGLYESASQSLADAPKARAVQAFIEAQKSQTQGAR